MARSAIEKKLTGIDKVPTLNDPSLNRSSGTFVTLKIDGHLRGCIGNIEAAGSIYEAIKSNALNAAFCDYRFSPLRLDELKQVHIDISILTPASALSYDDAHDLLMKLRPGIDGVILRHGAAAATFLPQVWDQLPNPEDFLGHLCRKAGLPEKAWRNFHPEILIYQVQCFEEEKKKEIVLSGDHLRRLTDVYKEIETEYTRVAALLDFSCQGCPDNCCDSYFEHHTYVEWSYLWQGFKQLTIEKQREILQRAEKYQEACQEAFAKNKRPQVMCPLNEKGLCILYQHRLLVCRTHGVPAVLTRPDGMRLEFPGCFRCQELVAERNQDAKTVPCMDRTSLLRRLALLENDLFEGGRHLYPKIKLTIAQMLLKGPPSIVCPHCER